VIHISQKSSPRFLTIQKVDAPGAFYIFEQVFFWFET